MTRKILALVAVVSFTLAPAFALAEPPAPAKSADRSARALARLLQHPALRGASVSVSVVDLATGDVLLAHEPDRRLVPASSQKLLVAATALARFGPTYQFETELYRTGALSGSGTLDGALWIVGRGDPSLVSESLLRLAEEIQVTGIREIRGGIGVDATWFDGQATHPDWKPISRRAYHSPTGALVANYSSFRLDVHAGTATQRARVSVLPSIPYFELSSDAMTVAGRAELALSVVALADGSGERVRVTGSKRVGQRPTTYYRAVSLPERYAAELLRAQLERLGVRVAGDVRMGPLPSGARELLRFPGEPVAQIVRSMNKYSNNLIAEQLTKALGASFRSPPGTWESGVSVVREYLEGVGAIDRSAIVADGSGLSPRNRISSAALARVVREASTRFGSGPEFLASLPLGGQDGTLESRRYDGAVPVRGKTGHLRRVASLAGVLPDADLRLRAFAILVNGARGDRTAVDDAIDQFVTALTESAFTQASATEGGLNDWPSHVSVGHSVYYSGM
jgi:D-alanyl-D-alanine carboxypeptidase/D-alanyl-D-alanine-endopeptidase (penicillin-binding protein 4)